MSAEALFSLPKQPAAADYSGKVPVEHLDYDYITKCKDVKYLEKILRLLRSGDEGIYPHLIKFCENHLEKLDPKSRALRKENPVATAASICVEEWSQIVDELKTWEEETRKTETSLNQQSMFGDSAKENMPPIRGSNCSVPLIQNSDPNEKRNPVKRALPRDYQEWDKFDVDKECERTDGNIARNDPPAIINTGHPKIKTKVDTSCNTLCIQLLSETEKRIKETQPGQQSKGKKILIREVEEEEDNGGDEPQEEQTVCPVEPSQPVGGEESAAAPVERGDMGNAQKKPHGRGDGGPHSESGNSHHGHWRSRGGSSDKYKVTQESKEKVANGTGKRGSTASVQADQSSSSSSKGTPVGGNAGETVNLDAPCGSLPLPLARLKNEGNLLFKNGQFADALEKYSQAIQGYTDSGIDSPEDLCILYSNRAACYLKDGNSQDCIQDCTRSLELQPFSLKPLLRRAMAYESLERYRLAYADYKTVLQIDISVQAAHDSVNRITRMLIDQDGPEWREKLPEIPLVPLSAQQHRREEPPTAEVLKARAEKAARDAERKTEVRFTALKQEGNDSVKKGQYQDALGKYTECLKLKPEECSIYTNRALCYLKLERFSEAKQDCDAALKLEPTNKKAFYRRALANKGLKDYLACSSDLQEVLQQDPNVQEAEKELEEVTVLLRQSLANASPVKLRKTVPITEVEGDEETSAGLHPDSSCRGEEITINLQANNAYDFGQALNIARSSGNMAACAELLSSTSPEMLPDFLSTQLDGHTISFIMQTLDTHLLEKDPNLVYKHLNHLHTADRFSVVLMLLEKDERRHMTQLFEHLSAVESTEFTKNDVQNLANKYI
ncbi:hypothetical protein PAMA_014742 [Pampus argenteus]